MSADDDRHFDEYLAGDSRLSRLYREAADGDEAPSPGIDERLRAAARREVAAGPRPARSRRTTWYRPLAAAAVITLVVGVTLQVIEQNRGLRPGEPASMERAAPARKTGEEPGTEAAGADAPAPRALEYRQAEPTRQAPAPDAAVPPADGTTRMGPATAPDAAGDALDAPGAARAPDPRAWMNDVRELVERGELAAARQSLARLRERYPGYPLPPDLQRLLKGEDTNGVPE